MSVCENDLYIVAYIKKMRNNLYIVKQYFFTDFILIFGVISIIFFISKSVYYTEQISFVFFNYFIFSFVICGLIYLFFPALNIYKLTRKLNNVRRETNGINNIIAGDKINIIKNKISNFKQLMNTSLVQQEREYYYSHIKNLERRNNELYLYKKENELEIIVNSAKSKATNTINKKLKNNPLLKFEKSVHEHIANLQSKKKQMELLWLEQYNQLSWWGKMNCESTRADTSKIDFSLKELEKAQFEFQSKYKQDAKKLRFFYEEKHKLVIERIDNSYKKALKGLKECRSREVKTDRFLQYSMWGGAFGMSASLINELYDSHQVYDALRNVNGNFEHMSDLDIWWECLWMPSEELAGLINLTKGAYFEQMVAEQYSGQLHEYFNTPDTDIIIDGIEYQIKATDSISYINSVNADIPIIATSEVSERMDLIDSGISNIDITQDTINALGGSVVDIGDVAFDGLLSSCGCLGFFATLHGINHASSQYEKTGDAGTAIEEGLGVAIVGTAKGIVDTSEMAYNIATSKPSKAIGRGMLKFAEGTARWMEKKGI